MSLPYRPLDRPVQFLKGVGPRRSALLGKLGLVTARDVLYHVPRRYEDASTIRPIRTLEAGMDATVVGRIVSQGVLPTRKGLRIFQAVLRDRSGLIECAWPGQPFLDRVFRPGDLVLATGTVRFFHGRQLQPREYVILARAGESAGAEVGAVFPVYPATEGLPQWQIRKLIRNNLEDLLRDLAEEGDPIPAEVLDRYGLPPIEVAFRFLHHPESLAEAEQGRRRLAFDELFYLQLLHARTHYEQSVEQEGIRFERRDALVRPFYRNLPFELTRAQKRVLREIGEDMASDRRMHRLLQGDVGAGKTVVALMAMLRAVENGYQAALMAPTEILAEQHVRTLRSLLRDLPVRVQLLTGRMGSAAHRRALQAIASGEAQIIVGTHALIQEKVSFHRLGLAVVDEQHRFGVRQRLTLAEMGGRAGEPEPDVLLMSATPIPRSLALTLYGDLDLSVLDERPPGRRPVRTALRPPSARTAVLEFVREQVRAGRQAYLIFPLVEESEVMQLKAATDEFEHLSSDVFPELRLGLLHGQMPSDEKDRVMREFADGKIDILVATSVVEVGIDVPNATVMVIEHAERFGLSQLHQLRGRVGRGGEQSYCVLLQAHPGAIERLRLFASTEDGFRIAEEDLRLRGQGDLFGERQSGIPAFRFADLSRDASLLIAARGEARRLVEEDPSLAEHPRLAQELEQRYGKQARLYQTG